MRQTKITKQGRVLAENLGVMGPHVRTCSLIARNAKTYARRQEEACSYEWAQGYKWDKRDAQLEHHLIMLVQSLGEGYNVEFSGDPRGYCVYIKTPDNRMGGDWGRRGVAALEDRIGGVK